ncbi:hypothetical protein [Anaerococcus degeneri]|uniref:Uncharacterized protein n=1 Tax=Anaerococcus degeneri TaxID=361500 RepID=A0ABS7YZS1_9FIRM|nr:hypothetical protein [Anaerococcus degeneri]MBP2015635.1 chromosome segregation ATPase [Anaerococcus degeneri]MCA2095996.1 hypothetical protein [Anaerococcus degeneri]
MKKKIIITSLVMTSVLPFIGGMKIAKAEEAKNQSVKAKSDLDQAREKLEAAKENKAKLEKELEQAKNDAEVKQKEADKQAELDKIAQAEENIKSDEQILAKDQEIKELNKKIEELKQREIEVNNELDAAEQTYENAKQAYETEKANPGSTKNLTSEQRVNDLNNQYDIAEEHHGDDQKKKKALEKELENLENELFKAYGQKMGIEEFFKEFESNPANINIRNTPEYLEFKDKSLAEVKDIEDKYNNIEKQIEKKKKEIAENQYRLEKSEASRDEESNAYKKEKLAKEFEDNYTTDEKLAEKELEKAKNLEHAKKQFDEISKDIEGAIKKYEALKSKEADKQKDLEKSSALAKWLNDKAADDKDGFAKANKELLSKIAQGHEDRKNKLIQDKNKNKESNDKLKRELEYKIEAEYGAAKDEYETYRNSLASIKELREFVKAKKNGKAKEIILQSLKEKLAQAQNDLDKKKTKLEAIGKEEQALLNMKNDLGVLTDSQIQDAKAKVQSKKAEIEKIKKNIKDIEESEKLKNLRAINYQIKALDLQIKELQRQINILENARNKNESMRPDYRIGDMGLDNISDDYDIDLSSFSLEKMDKKARLKNSYLRLKGSVNRAKEVVTLAENYAKTGKMDANKRAKLVKLIEKLKVNIGLVEKYLAKLEASL